MTYLTFLLVFVVPPILVLAGASVRAGSLSRSHLAAIGLMVFMAVVYTTPWDNHLVRRGIWTYGADRVLATIGYVPVEEYLFFVLQPILTGLWWSRLAHRRADAAAPTRAGQGVRTALLVLAAALFLGGLAALRVPSGQYFGLLLVWAAPVLAVQWAYDAPLLRARTAEVAVAVGVPTLYLWVADWIAMRLGIWHITEATSLAFRPLGMPLEEMAFFLLTNLMVVQGALLAADVFERGLRLPALRGRRLPDA